MESHSHFLAHSSSVNCLRFGRKSGKMLGTGGEDQIVNIWRLRDRETKNLLSLSGHASAIESIVFDPNERKIVAGSKAGSIKSFDLETGKVSRTLKGHMSTCTALDHHLYGDYIASGSLDTIVKVWDLRTKGCMQTFRGHLSEITKLAFTPDGRWLTSADLNGNIKIWDLTVGKILKTFSDHSNAITALEFNPEEFILVSSSADKTVRFYDVQEFEYVGVTPIDSATTTAIAHTTMGPYSGKYVACCSQDFVRLWTYEVALECQDSISCHHVNDIAQMDAPMDALMQEDMKLVVGCTQNAFVSINILDLTEMKPFEHMKMGNNRLYRKEQSTKALAPTELHRCKTPTRKSVDNQRSLERNPSAHRVRPTTPGIHVAAYTKSIKPVPSTLHSQSATRVTISQDPIDVPMESIDLPSNQDSNTQDTIAVTGSLGDTSSFIIELRCGMDINIKTFHARQRCMRQLLIYWKEGRIHDAFQYISQLSRGKREAIFVDVLRACSLQSIMLDLEACCMLLPMTQELLNSKFEMYISVGLNAAQEMSDAFLHVIRESKELIRVRAREVDLAAEKRAERCAKCDAYFKELEQTLTDLKQRTQNKELHVKISRLMESLSGSR